MESPKPIVRNLLSLTCYIISVKVLAFVITKDVYEKWKNIEWKEVALIRSQKLYCNFPSESALNHQKAFIVVF
jgi:hypothetical protein